MLSQVIYETQSTQTDPVVDLVGFGVLIAVSVFYVACTWRIFTKAGKPGWHALVPILNTYTLIKVAGRPGWWVLLTFLPCIGFVVMVVVFLDLARQFGKSPAFGIGLVFLSPIFIPILAFGRAEHAASRRSTRYSPAPAAPMQYGAATAVWGGAGPVADVPVPPPAPAPGGVGAPPGLPAAAHAGPSTLPPLSATQSGPPAAPLQAESAEPPAAAGPAPAPEAGWYLDPADPTLLRWWDGSAWSAHTHPQAGDA